MNQVWLTSPDSESYNLQPLAFTQTDGVLSLTVPNLVVWDVLLVDWSE